MDRLRIERTKYTLEIDLDPVSGKLQLTGESYPENARAFFAPVFSWLDQYLKTNPENVNAELSLDYLNTSSTKCLLDFLEVLEKFRSGGGTVNVTWFYSKDDEDTLTMGQDIAEDTELPIQFVER
ncbi:MAG: DUF1987 domain-containing protein [Acidobacteria bacterium]|nr:DUF1987 domain-containing protein [Acidobacteriota bacterium]MCG3192780.1 hypothetical protein [Thermoanaerobaculia bacterium]MCK6681172.1 DUF1987 domain-containing protein [Thermoanaerobaculia bacterium]